MAGSSKKIKDADLHLAFPKDALTFLHNLERNNNKKWFVAHKAEYEEHVLGFMKILVIALGKKMEKKLKGLKYEDKVNGSIFRIYRDVRFSRDKRPYKIHAAAFWWVGPGPKLGCPGIYFHLDAKKLMIGAGLYQFEKEALEAYRKYVNRKGFEFQNAIQKAEYAGFELGGEKLKKVPSGYEQDHKHAELLKYKGLHVSKSYPASTVTKVDLVEWLPEEYKPALDLVKVLEKAVF